jgi:hypothetical protein
MTLAKVNWDGTPLPQPPRKPEPIKSYWGSEINAPFISSGEPQQNAATPPLPPYDSMSVAERDLLDERYEFLNSVYMDSSLSETKRDRAFREAQELIKQAFSDRPVSGSGQLKNEAIGNIPGRGMKFIKGE